MFFDDGVWVFWDFQDVFWWWCVGILGFSGCFLMMVCGYFGIFKMFF